jgi:hypothetical protein
MIVLDEQLPVRTLADAIRRWYRGRVCVVTDLRPATVIKDDVVPDLLHRVSQPTFVTLNWSDFWQRSAAHRSFCLVCFTLPTNRATDISPLLRRLFRLEPFKTKAARMGKVARVSHEQVAFYQVDDREIHLYAIPKQMVWTALALQSQFEGPSDLFRVLPPADGEDREVRVALSEPTGSGIGVVGHEGAARAVGAVVPRHVSSRSVSGCTLATPPLAVCRRPDHRRRSQRRRGDRSRPPAMLLMLYGDDRFPARLEARPGRLIGPLHWRPPTPGSRESPRRLAGDQALGKSPGSPRTALARPHGLPDRGTTAPGH